MIGEKGSKGVNSVPLHTTIVFVFVFVFIVCFTSYFVFSMAVLPQSWGSVLPSIVEMRDQNSRGRPLLFSNRNLGSFCA